MASISLKWHFLGWQRWWSKSKLSTNLVNTSICNSFWKKRLPAKKCLYFLRFNSNLGYTKTQLLFVGNSSWPRNLWNFFVFVRWSKQIHPPFRISCQSIQLLPGFFGMFVDIYVFGTLPWKFNMATQISGGLLDDAAYIIISTPNLNLSILGIYTKSIAAGFPPSKTHPFTKRPTFMAFQLLTRFNP